MNRWQFITVVVVLIGLVANAVYEKFWADKQLTTNPLPSVFKNEKARVENINLPSKIDFCGEEVPLNRTDIRERLDRELIANAYLHASTIFIIKRAYRWFPTIEPILKAEGVPDDFKYMAVIESALEHVVSPAGAAGFWQLMPETAREHGLEVNEMVDERYHVEKSTLVACQYLKQSYTRLGAWTNVAASYNMGVFGFKSALEKQKVNSYYDVWINEETSRFVYRILALKEIMKNPALYGFNIADEDRYAPRLTKTIDIDSNIYDLADFSLKLGINYKTLKTYNRWILSDKLLVKTEALRKGKKILVSTATTKKYVLELPKE